MRMRRMLAIARGRKAKHPLRIGIAVGEPAFDQPVEHAIERDAIESEVAERLLDLVMSQRCRRSAQQRRTRTRAGVARAPCGESAGRRLQLRQASSTEAMAELVIMTANLSTARPCLQHSCKIAPAILQRRRSGPV
jgi:hypothetical protein